jgi:hypothetical protein
MQRWRGREDRWHWAGWVNTGVAMSDAEAGQGSGQVPALADGTTLAAQMLPQDGGQ